MDAVSPSPFRSACLRYARLAAPPAALVGLIVPLFLFSGMETVALFAAPQMEELSIGAVCFLLTILTAFPVCVIAYRLYSHLRDDLTDVEKTIERGRQDWIGRLAVSFAVMTISAVVCGAAFGLIGSAFTNARVTYIMAAVICAAYSGALGFAVAYYITGLGKQNLLALVGVVAVGGIFISFLVAQDDEWWRESISFLGYDPGSSIIFNLTIIMTGLIALTFSRDLIDDLQVLNQMGRIPLNSFRFIRVGLTLICLGIVGIGLFPTAISDLSTFVHNLFAHSMALLFIIAMLALDRFAPAIYPASFIRTSRIAGAVCVAAFIAYYGLNIINFVALELILFICFGVWVYLFNRHTKNYIRAQNPHEVLRATMEIRQAQ
ncbi:MAG: hypothetical protein BroJett038_13030 [Chloroflexota bacterium]|nr:MAG: hypothetical protein BroJett038_13030 [Chloroflexota bacterium]